MSPFDFTIMTCALCWSGVGKVPDMTADDYRGALKQVGELAAMADERLRELIPQAAAAGVPEAEIARLAGISRNRVRRLLGKPTDY